MLLIVQAVDDGDGGGGTDLVHDIPGHTVLLQVVEADHQRVQVAGEDQAGVVPGLLVLALHIVLAVVLGVAAQLGHARLKGHPGSGGGLGKNHAQGLIFQQLVLRAHGVLALQVEGHVQNGLDFLAGVVHQGHKVFSAHIGSHCCSPPKK